MLESFIGRNEIEQNITHQLEYSQNPTVRQEKQGSRNTKMKFKIQASRQVRDLHLNRTKTTDDLKEFTQRLKSLVELWRVFIE